jgi:hypothetical protein
VSKQTHSLASRLQDLLSRAEVTDTPNHKDFYHYEAILQERTEALQLLRELAAKDAIKTHFCIALKSRAYKTASAAVKAKIGHDWIERFKDHERREAIGELVRELRGLIGWAAMQEEKARKGETGEDNL